MSSVDNRIVNMHFENKQFQKGIAESSSALTKFSNTLSSIGSTASTGLSALAQPVDYVAKQFTLFGKIVQNVKQEIANALTEMGKSVVNVASDLVNPIAKMGDGFSEYEQTINATQTLLNGVRKEFKTDAEALDAVTKKLQELNKYSDDTIYKFGDMTKNITKFTNAGVNLNDSVSAMQGIANLAALSGATTEQAAHAMYNFGQALGTGVVKLIDWKSISNASMDTDEFKTYLVEAAIAAGTMIKVGDKYQTTTTDMQGKTSDLLTVQQMFNEGLKNQWLTTEVLMDTLKDYADPKTDIGKKAKAAAQEVKTLSMVLDTLGESIGSGWANSFLIISGNLEEAKKLWTPVSIALNDFAGASADARNKVLQDWKDLGGRTSVINGLASMFKAFGAVLGTIGKAFRDVFPPTTGAQWAEMSKSFEKFAKTLMPSEKALKQLERIMRGVFAAFKLVGDVIGFVIKGISALFGALGFAASDSGFLSYLIEMIASFADWVQGMDQIIDSTFLFNKAMEALEPLLVKVKEAYQKMVAFFKESPIIQGLIDGLKSGVTEAVEWIKHIGQMIIDAFKKLFGIKSPSKVFFEFGEMIIAGLVNGISSVIKMVMDVGEAILSALFKSMLNMNPKSIFYKLLDGIYSGIRFITTSIESFGGLIASVFENIFGRSNLGDAGLSLMRSLESGMNNGLSGIYNFFYKLKDIVTEGLLAFGSFGSGIFNAAVAGLTSLGNSLRDFGSYISNLDFHPLDTLQNKLNGLSSSTGVLGKIGEAFNTFIDAMKTAWGYIKSIFGPMITFIVDKFQQLNLGVIAQLLTGGGLLMAGRGIYNFAKGVSSVFEPIGNLFDNVGGAIENFTKRINAPSIKTIAISVGILALAIAGLSFIDGNKLAISLGIVTALITELVTAMKGLAMIGTLSGGGATKMIGIGIAVSILAGAVAKLAAVNPDAIGAAVLALSALVAALVGFMYISAKGKMDVTAMQLIGLGIAMSLFASSVVKLSSVSWDGLKKAAAALIGLGVALTVISLFAKGANFADFSKHMITLSIGLLMFAGAIKLYASIHDDTLVKGIFTTALALGAIGLATRAFSEKSSIALIRLSIGLAMLAIPIKIFAMMDWGTWGKGFFTIAVALAAFGAAMRLFPKDMNVKLISLSVGLMLIAVAFKTLGSLSFWSWVGAMVAFVVILGSLAVFFVMLENSSKDIVKLSGAILLFGLAITVLMIPIVALGILPWSIIIGGLVLFGVTLAALVIALKKMPPADQLPGMASGLLKLTVAIGSLMAVIVLVGMIDLKTIGTGIGVLVAALVALVAALAALWYVSKSADLTKIGLGMLAISAAIAILMGMVIAVGSISFESFAQGILGLIAVLGTLFLVLDKIPANIKMIGIGIGLAAIGAGLIVLAIPLMMLANFPWQGLLAGAGGLAIILGTLGFISPAIMAAGASLLWLGGSIALIGVGVYLAAEGLQTFVETIVYVVEQINRFGKWLWSWFSDEELPAVESFDKSATAINKTVDEKLNPDKFEQQGAYIVQSTNKGMTAEGKKLEKTASDIGNKTGNAYDKGLNSKSNGVGGFIQDKMSDLKNLGKDIPNIMGDISGSMGLDPNKMEIVPKQLQDMMKQSDDATANGSKDILTNLDNFNTGVSNKIETTTVNINKLPNNTKKMFEMTNVRFRDENGKIGDQVYNLKSMIDSTGNIDITSLPNNVQKMLSDSAEAFRQEQGPFKAQIDKFSKNVVDNYGQALNPELSKTVTTHFINGAVYALDENGKRIPEALGKIGSDGGIIFNMEFFKQNPGKTMKDYIGKAVHVVKDDGNGFKMAMGSMVKDGTVAFDSSLKDSTFGEAAKKIPQTVTQEIEKGTEQVKESSTKLGTEAVAGVSKVLTPEVGSNIMSDFLGEGGMLGSLLGGGSKVIDAASELGTGIKNKISSSINKDAFTQPMTEALDGLKTPITEAQNTIPPMMTKLGTDTKNKATENINTDAYKKIGKSIPEGLTQGVKDGTASLLSAINDMSKKAASAARKALDSHSPSQVFAEIGKDVDDGLAQGIVKNIPTITNATTQAGESATESMRISLSSLSDTQFDLNANPVITPVLDLDQVKTDAKLIPGMLNSATGKTNVNVSSVQGMIGYRQNEIKTTEDTTTKTTGSISAITMNNTYNVKNESDARQISNKLGTLMTRLQFAKGAV